MSEAHATDKMICDMEEHGPNGDMRKDALSVAATALETNHEDSSISKHIKAFFDQKVEKI